MEVLLAKQQHEARLRAVKSLGASDSDEDDDVASWAVKSREKQAAFAARHAQLEEEEKRRAARERRTAVARAEQVWW